MQGFQTHTAIQPISIQPLQTQQKPRVTEVLYPDSEPIQNV